MTAAFGVLAVLLAIRAPGFWGHLLRSPGVIDGDSLRAVLSYAVGPLLMAGAFWVVSWGLGRRVLRAAAVPGEVIIPAALGLGLLGQATFFLGWAGGLSPWPLALLFLTAAALAAGELRPPAWPRPRPGPLAGAAAGLLAFAGVCALLRALAPPTEWDVRAYHLALPELALRAGRDASVAWMLHSHWPHLMENLYALPLAAGRDGAAALIHLGASGLLLAGVFSCARRAAGPVAAGVAVLLLAAQPALLREAGTAHSDGAAALFAFAAAGALSRWDKKGGAPWLAAAGALAGFAASSKMTLLAALAAWALWIFFMRRRRRDAAVFLSCGLLVVGPWLLRTWLETGDPVWPFLSGLLGLREAAALAERLRLSVSQGFPPPLWVLTLDGPGFLLIPCAGLWALAGKDAGEASPEERWLWIQAPLLFLLIYHTTSVWRCMMPWWPALALFAGRAAAAAFKRGPARSVAAAALVAGGLVPIVMATPNNELFAVLALRPAAAAAGVDRRAHWEDRALGITAFYREARAALPPGAKVLLFREIRGYGAGFDYLWGDPMNQALIDYRAISDPEALFARLKSLGVTHVLENTASGLYREDPGYYDRRTLALMGECLIRHASVVLEREGVVLHRLRSLSVRRRREGGRT